ncbi:hypothetical protein WDU94_010513 [Cyamophila willieti]
MPWVDLKKYLCLGENWSIFFHSLSISKFGHSASYRLRVGHNFIITYSTSCVEAFDFDTHTVHENLIPTVAGQYQGETYEDPFAKPTQVTNLTDPYGKPGDNQQYRKPVATVDPYAKQNDPYGKQNDPYAKQTKSSDAYAMQNDPYAQTVVDPYAPTNETMMDQYGQSIESYADDIDPFAKRTDLYSSVEQQDMYNNKPYADTHNKEMDQDPFRKPSANELSYAKDTFGQGIEPYRKDSYGKQTEPYRKDSYGKQTETYGKDPYRKDSYGKETETYRKDSFGKPAEPYTQVEPYKNGYEKDADPFAKDPYAKTDAYYDEDDPYSKSYSEEAYTNEEETYYYSRNQQEDNKFVAEVTVEEVPDDKPTDSLLSRRGK